MSTKRVRILSFLLCLMLLWGLITDQAEAGSFSKLINSNNTYTWTYKNWDGSVLQSSGQTGELRKATTTYQGATPTRPSDSLYSYSFSDWSMTTTNKMVKRGTEFAHDITYTYTAQYTATLRDPNMRVIVWKNHNGTELKRDYLTLGALPVWEGDSPVKESDERNDYTFSGWSPAVSTVTEDTEYTAQYTATQARYLVTWENYDHTALKTVQNAAFDAIPAYDGETPVRADDAASSYSFSDWLMSTSIADRTVVYTAQYNASPRSYTVSWTNWDGTLLTTDSVTCGGQAVYSGQTPSRSMDAMYNYTFQGWTPDAGIRISGDTVFTAVYAASLRDDFTVTWKNWDGTVLETDECTAYGVTPEYNGENPVREADDLNTYEFLGWVPETGPVTKDAVYTASFLPTARRYTVTWKDWNGAVLGTEEYGWGSMPSYPGDEPERESDAQWRYSFSGWTPEIIPVEGNTEYIAQYDASPNEYTLKFRDEDGISAFTEIPDQTVAYGETAQTPAFIPAKEGWRFLGWVHNGETFDLNAPMTGAEDSEIILTPVFSKLYTVSASHADAGGNGGGSAAWRSETSEVTNQEVTAVEGEHITVTAAPEEGSALSAFIIRYLEAGLLVDVPYALTQDNTAEFDMPAADVVISARFMLNDDILDDLKDPEDENLYHIRSENDLVLLSKWNETHDMAGQTIRLENDLNMAGVTFEGFSGPFRGTFLGGGYTIRNLLVHGFAGASTDRVAFFWNLQGSVSGLTVTGSVSDGAGASATSS